MRLIDADKIQEEYKQEHDGKRLLLIDVAPTIDAVPVVRCKDCKQSKRYDEFEVNNLCCRILTRRIGYNFYVNDDWFCADGERRC